MEKQALIAVMSMLILEMVEDLTQDGKRTPSDALTKHLEAIRYFAEENNITLSKSVTSLTAKQDLENAILYHAKKFISKVKSNENKERKKENI